MCRHVSYISTFKRVISISCDKLYPAVRTLADKVKWSYLSGSKANLNPYPWSYFLIFISIEFMPKKKRKGQIKTESVLYLFPLGYWAK